ncbi:hypothetical protein Patl1_20331 [Pistacia atlantica]|uniref:Uncharacterized protein n=1 Tax=Pistacia atlantica TaxID=434234 RepID=A0ACC1BM80_9ROSI|nr:hypothetical protein Patl1_20331 [Pistacia atlantica]
MFHDALQSGIVEVTDFPQKVLHCFQWGLQNLSCFGQNLQTSTFIWENFFAVWITISGLVLFLFLIGNMQTYLQSKTIRSEEMRLKRREIEQWMSFGKLSENLQQQVKKHQRYIWRETNGVDVDNLLNNLPKDLRMNIKRELCSELLKKVEEFKKLNEKILDALCDCVKPAFYIERTHIICEGDPIDELLFIVHGKLWTYTSKAKTISSSSAYHLKDGDFCGEELIAWALDEPLSSNLPMSTRTIQALTKVEAFALLANDLKNVYKLFKRLNRTQLQHAFRYYSEHWRTWAACRIQAAWRCYTEKMREKSVTTERNRQDDWPKTGWITSNSGASIHTSKFTLNSLFVNRCNGYERITQIIPPTRRPALIKNYSLVRSL